MSRVWECIGLFDQPDRFERDLGPAGRTPHPTRYASVGALADGSALAAPPCSAARW
jgi:hypothetical protein